MRKKVGLDNRSLVEPFPDAKDKGRQADLGKRKIKSLDLVILHLKCLKWPLEGHWAS